MVIRINEGMVDGQPDMYSSCSMALQYNSSLMSHQTIISASSANLGEEQEVAVEIVVLQLTAARVPADPRKCRLGLPGAVLR